MESILFLAHTESNGTLGKAALEALATAKVLADGLGGGAFTAGLVGGEVQGAANSIAACGATRFLGVSGPDFSQSRYASDAGAAEAVCRAAGATLILSPTTSRWSRVLPGVAQRLDGRIDTHVTGISTGDGKVSISRWYYRQRMEAALTRATRPWVVLLELGYQEPWKGAAGAATVEALTVNLPEPCKRTRVIGVQAPPADQQTIRPDADLLFVAGAGWTKPQADGQVHAGEAETLILDFLRKTKASLGGSKSLVDLSGEGQAVLRFMTHLNQIGQTGATPRHPKGLSTCCHGEEPHVVGWRFVTERRAVNLDSNCGWARGKADVLYVADAFEVMRKLNQFLGQQ